MLRKYVIGEGGERVLAFEPDNDAERAAMKTAEIPIADEIVSAREDELNPPQPKAKAPAKKQPAPGGDE